MTIDLGSLADFGQFLIGGLLVVIWFFIRRVLTNVDILDTAVNKIDRRIVRVETKLGIIDIENGKNELT